MSTETAARRRDKTGSDVAPFDPEQRWSLHPNIALRPEPFGALLYHYGTRRLTFLKERRLCQAVSLLGSHPTALAACRAAGVTQEEQPRFTAALRRLADSEMLVRGAGEDPPT